MQLLLFLSALIGLSEGRIEERGRQEVEDGQLETYLQLSSSTAFYMRCLVFVVRLNEIIVHVYLGWDNFQRWILGWLHVGQTIWVLRFSISFTFRRIFHTIQLLPFTPNTLLFIIYRVFCFVTGILLPLTLIYYSGAADLNSRILLYGPGYVPSKSSPPNENKSEMRLAFIYRSANFISLSTLCSAKRNAPIICRLWHAESQRQRESSRWLHVHIHTYICKCRSECVCVSWVH